MADTLQNSRPVSETMPVPSTGASAKAPDSGMNSRLSSILTDFEKAQKLITGTVERLLEVEEELELAMAEAKLMEKSLITLNREGTPPESDLLHDRRVPDLENLKASFLAKVVDIIISTRRQVEEVHPSNDKLPVSQYRDTACSSDERTEQQISSVASTECTLLHLSDEVLSRIFANESLSSIDVANVRTTSYRLNMVASSNSVWFSKFHKEYPSLTEGVRETANHTPTGWLKAYEQQKRIESNWKEGVCGVHRALEGHKDWVMCLQFDEDKVVTGSRDNTVKVWDLKSACCTATLYGHTGTVWCLAFDELRIVSGSNDRTVKIWGIYSGQCVHTLDGHTGGIRAIKIVGSKVVTGSTDRTLKLWDAHSGSCLQSLREHTGYIFTLDFDGRYIVSGSTDRLIKVWDVTTGQCLRTLRGHDGGVRVLQRLGDIVISGSYDNTVRVWSFSTGELLHTLSGHSEGVSCLQFDKHRLVTGGDDHRIIVWDLKAMKKMYALRAHRENLWCLHYNNSKLISGSCDKTLKVWDFGADVVQNCKETEVEMQEAQETQQPVAATTEPERLIPNPHAPTFVRPPGHKPQPQPQPQPQEALKVPSNRGEMTYMQMLQMQHYFAQYQAMMQSQEREAQSGGSAHQGKSDKQLLREWLQRNGYGSNSQYPANANQAQTHVKTEVTDDYGKFITE